VHHAEVIAHVGARTEQALLLSGPQRDAHRALHRQVERLQNAQRLQHHRGTGGIVGRAGARVPRVEMRAEHYNLVLEPRIGPGNLADDVEGIQIAVQEATLIVDLEGDWYALLDGAHDAAVVLRRHDDAGHCRGSIDVSRHPVRREHRSAVATSRRHRAERSFVHEELRALAIELLYGSESAATAAAASTATPALLRYGRRKRIESRVGESSRERRELRLHSRRG